MYFVFTWELNLLLSCFGLSALNSAHILKQLTQPAGLAFLNSGTGMVLYNSTVYGRGHLGSIWGKTQRLPAFYDLAVLLIYAMSIWYLKGICLIVMA